MHLKLKAFGIAKDILGSRVIEMEIENDSTIGALKAVLIQKYPAFADLASLSFAVDESYQTDDFVLAINQEVVIIPPVAGG